MGTALRYSLLWASTVFVSSCGSLLPSERAEVQSPFVDYLDAELRYSQAQPGSTTRSQLFGLGFDPLTQGNGRMLSFIDVRLMFIQPNIPIDYLPGGLVQCLEAKDRCIGYAFDFSKTDTQRVGSFWRTCSTSARNGVAGLVVQGGVRLRQRRAGAQGQQRRTEHPSPGRQEEPAGSAAGRGRVLLRQAQVIRLRAWVNRRRAVGRRSSLGYNSAP